MNKLLVGAIGLMDGRNQDQKLLKTQATWLRELKMRRKLAMYANPDYANKVFVCQYNMLQIVPGLTAQ